MVVLWLKTILQGEYNYCNMKDLLGDGIFAVDGAKWQHQRKVASIDFSRRVLRDYSTKTFKDNVKKLAVLICEAAIANTRINIQVTSSLADVVSCITKSNIDHLLTHRTCS